MMPDPTTITPEVERRYMTDVGFHASAVLLRRHFGCPTDDAVRLVLLIESFLVPPEAPE